ncbi:MAG: SxtJ family membrane protein [Elusimicrobia bacterium]|nr:SxtJ family membrane protein [Candidatus Obscuribacterium magneticum]
MITNITTINWKPSNADLRKFGLTLLIGFGLIGALVFWRSSHAAAFWMWGISTSVGLLAIAVPFLSKPFYWAWMGVAFVMGTIVSTLILLLIFYLIISPVALFMKLVGRDSLRLKKKSYPNETYWVELPQPKSKDCYERLF